MAMTSEGRQLLAHFAALTVLALFALLNLAPPAHAELGDRVVNVATVSHETDELGQIFQTTNEAVFVIEAVRTPSTIEFFRYAPLASTQVDARAFGTTINGSDFSPSGNGDDFIPVGDPVTSNGVVLDFSGEVSLTPADTYLSGELMIVRVIDLGQNGNAKTIETVAITIATDNGDEITLRLYESGPDTGEFYAYVPSSRDPSSQNDAVLTAPANTNLRATYIDTFDSTEVSVDTALVDPFSRVFDSLTGCLLYTSDAADD